MIRAIRALPRTVWLLGTISLVNDFASDMIYPLVPLYLASVLLAGPKALGLIEGVAEAASSLLKLFAGVFADRIGKGLRSAPRDALISLSVEPQQRGLAFGFHRAMDNLGAVIGPLAAAGLLALGVDLRHVFLLSVVPALLVLLLAFKVPEPARKPALSKQPMRWTLAGLPSPFRRYLAVLALFTLGNSSNMFLLLRASELGAGATRTTLMWALFSAVAALLSTPLSALSDRCGRANMLALAWFAYALAYFAIGHLPHADWALWLAFAGYGVVTAALEGTEKAFVADLVPGEQSGTAFGWYNLVAGLLLLPASVLFGWLWSAGSPTLAFGFGAGCAMLAAILLKIWVLR